MKHVEAGSRVLAAVAYAVTLLWIVLVASDLRRDSFLRHHGWQAASWDMVRWLLIVLLLAVRRLGQPTLDVLWLQVMAALALVFAGLSLLFAVRALLGDRFVIPMVGRLTQRFAAEPGAIRPA